jgi:hypothetical protein
MLFRQQVLDGIAAGKIDLAFRRWRQARVKPGSRLRTPVGVVEIRSVDEVVPDGITQAQARRAGYATRDALMAELDAHAEGRLYRIGLHLAGADPRVALRERAAIGPAELAELKHRLDRLDQASRNGPWTARTLQLIADRPAVRAGDLAAALARDTPAFKRDVRKLKELGLTESLEVGYRLSRRGAALLRARPEG